MANYEKELDKYEKSVEDHVRKVSLQLDEELANINKKYKEKVELLRKMETENQKMAEDNEKMRAKMEQRKKKLSSFEKQIVKNRDNQLTYEANISEIREKLPLREKNIEEIQKALNEKRRQTIMKQNEYAGFQTNKTEISMRQKAGKSKKRLEEARKKKILQDKKIARLRKDIGKSEKSFDKIEIEIRKEIERQLENESKKDEIQRRIRIFEVENAGITDEFQKLLIGLNTDDTIENKEKRLGELRVLMTKGQKYLESLEEKIDKCRKLELKIPISNFKFRAKRSKSENPRSNSSKNWKKLEDLKKSIIALKREGEALRIMKGNLKEEKENLQKSMEECEREAERAAQELRNAENFRIAELNQINRQLQPSILLDSKSEKQSKIDTEKLEKIGEKIQLLEKSNNEKMEELDRLRKRSEFLHRQLKSHSEIDLVQFETEKTQKGAELRQLKKTYHEEIMQLNALNKKLQQRVLQREAVLTKANSVVHLATNVRDERNREIEELHKEMAETKAKF